MNLKIFIIILLPMISLISCSKQEIPPDTRIVFLHHSTGSVIWEGNTNTKIVKIAGKLSGRLAIFLKPKAQLPSLFRKFNKENKRKLLIQEMAFPKETPYGWNNNPYDYYNIWVKNAGEQPYIEEPTLEMLTKEYQVIIFKHCFPVCNIGKVEDSANINSDVKTLSNYKLQYIALRDKLHEFSNTKFILFTGTAQVKFNISEEEAGRAKEFFNWVTNEWKREGDNIYLWDLYGLQTEDGLYFKDKYAMSSKNSHPNVEFAGRACNLLFNRIIDVIDNDGNSTNLKGEKE